NEFFKLSEDEANLLDPQIRLFHETTYEAIYDAGINPDELRGSNTGVFIGSSYNDTESAIASKEFDVDAVIALTASRISKSFDFRGQCFMNDTACASSLSCVNEAYLAIKKGLAENIIVGGLDYQKNKSIAKLMQIEPFKKAIEECCQILESVSFDVKSVLSNTQTEYNNIIEALICTVTFQIATFETLTFIGVKADAFVGESIGEIITTYAQGHLSKYEVLWATYYIASTLHEQKNSGVMAAVDSVDNLTNFPTSIEFVGTDLNGFKIFSGQEDDMKKFIQILQKNDISVKTLKTCGTLLHNLNFEFCDLLCDKLRNFFTKKPENENLSEYLSKFMFHKLKVCDVPNDVSCIDLINIVCENGAVIIKNIIGVATNRRIPEQEVMTVAETFVPFKENVSASLEQVKQIREYNALCSSLVSKIATNNAFSENLDELKSQITNNENYNFLSMLVEAIEENKCLTNIHEIIEKHKDKLDDDFIVKTLDENLVTGEIDIVLENNDSRDVQYLEVNSTQSFVFPLVQERIYDNIMTC
ncbi:fatty acid synthase-like protein, partial [Leptotrombidium deliense]